MLNKNGQCIDASMLPFNNSNFTQSNLLYKISKLEEKIDKVSHVKV